MNYSVVSCASYGASGSGVITDYLAEFDNILNPGDFEFRFLQDYGGISTLEDCLVNSPHRLNSDIAIQNFIRYVEFQCGNFINRRYNRFFKGKFEAISRQFLSEIIEAEWPGYWEEYQILSPRIVTILKYQIFPRIKRLIKFQRSKYIAHFLPRSTMYFSNPTKDKFHNAVKKYINNLCCIVDPDQSYDYIFFDQIVPPTDIDRYFNYFDNMHAIVVDCDARDYYVKNVFKYGEPWVPTAIDNFIKVFKGIRKDIDAANENKNILRLRFEDTIFKYKEFASSVNEFLGLDERNHINRLKHFDPRISVRNTRLWLQYDVPPEIIRTIERELPEFCYDFPADDTIIV